MTTTIVIGGHTRKAGKTSVTEGVIRAFSQHPWTALKISAHWHADSQSQEAFLIHEETSSEMKSDSARYLAAGASRAFWIRVREGRMAELMPALLPILQSNPFVIVESNAILRHIQPDLYVMVLRYDLDDFKDSARETLSQAHAAIAIHPKLSSPEWRAFAQETTAGIPVFTTSDPQILPAEFLDFVKLRLKI